MRLGVLCRGRPSSTQALPGLKYDPNSRSAPRGICAGPTAGGYRHTGQVCGPAGALRIMAVSVLGIILLGYLAGPLPEWEANDSLAPQRTQLEAAIWPMAWVTQSQFSPLPLCTRSDNTAVRRAYQGGHVRGAL
eukprot:6414583-Pyramimonas_sp.AAC.1